MRPRCSVAKTEGSTPFRFSLHVGDVGHTLIIGPTGAGKSVLLALMALQFRRYAKAQVFAFDFGGSIRAAAIAMGGDWHDLGGALSDDDRHMPSPYSRSPRSTMPRSAPGPAEWIAAILAREGLTVSPDAKEHLWTALTLACLGSSGRTHAHGSRGAAAIQRAEAGAASLLHRRSVRPAA